MIDAYDKFCIANRHLSANEIDERFARKAGMDRHDLDAEILRDRDRRNEKYREIDGC